MTTINRTTFQTADQKLIDGLTKHKAAIPALPIGGKNVSIDGPVHEGPRSKLAPSRWANMAAATCIRSEPAVTYLCPAVGWCGGHQ